MVRGFAMASALAIVFGGQVAIAAGEAHRAIAGTVIQVTDGDTLVLRDAGGDNFIIRLTDIDAPETFHGTARPGQPFSVRATAHLKDLALGKAAQAECYDVDRRQSEDKARLRYICRVHVDAKDLSLAMIDAGLAMANRQSRRYVRDRAAYAHEDAARSQRVGLWSQPEPIPAWKWRQMCWQHKFCEAADRAP